MPSTCQAPTLREMRRAAGFRSGSAFARAIDMSVSTYVHYEAAPETITLRSAWAIADALGVTIDAVVGRASAEGAPALDTCGNPTYGARVTALDAPARGVVEEWLTLFERAGRSRLYPEGR